MKDAYKANRDDPLRKQLLSMFTFEYVEENDLCDFFGSHIRSVFVFGLGSLLDPLAGYESAKVAALKQSAVGIMLEGIAKSSGLVATFNAHQRHNALTRHNAPLGKLGPVEVEKPYIYVQDPFYSRKDLDLLQERFGYCMFEDVCVDNTGHALLEYTKRTNEALVISLQPTSPVRQIIADLAKDGTEVVPGDRRGGLPRAIICAPYTFNLDYDPLTNRVENLLRDNYDTVPILEDNNILGPLVLHKLKGKFW